MMEEYFNTLLQETERRMAAAAAGMEGKETVATCREMVSYLKAKNRELKAYALARPFSGNEEEIRYFKYYKPALTGRLLYYYRVYQIESGCPGCLRVAETYYRRAMERAERMMERYLPFYQYYHSGRHTGTITISCGRRANSAPKAAASCWTRKRSSPRATTYWRHA